MYFITCKISHTVNFRIQECIPVGCIPPAAVAICWRVSASVYAGIQPFPPPAWTWTPTLWCQLGPPVWAATPPGCGPGDTPVNRILDTRFWKYYLAPTSLWAVKMALIDPKNATTTLASNDDFMFQLRERLLLICIKQNCVKCMKYFFILNNF